MERNKHNDVTLQKNAATLYYIKSTIACVSGAYAGVLGLTNWAGFATFFVTSLATSFLVYSTKCRGRPGTYFASAHDVWTASVADNILPFVLFWTLAYALVHIYD